MPKSVLEAIKLGVWDYEPPEVAADRFSPADAMPGTEEKLTILAERLQSGLPLWHPADRDDAEADDRHGRERRAAGAGWSGPR